MNKDYAKKRRARFTKKSFFLPSWLGMLSTIALGIGLSTALYWKNHRDKSPNAKLTVAMQNPSGKIKQSSDVRFDFYTLLPNMAQETSELATAHPAPTVSNHPTLDIALAPTPALAKKDEKPSMYTLQAGSFRHLHQAEELKAKLALNGFTSSVQSCKLNNNETWYRVYVGPFKDKTLALRSQKKLEQAESIHSLIIKNNV